MEQIERERLEVSFWSEDKDHRPGANSINNLLNKTYDARVLWPMLEKYSDAFSGGTILELGGGQCWASCLIKRRSPNAKVIASDISPAAVAGIGEWEALYGVKVDRTFACRSYDIPVESGTVDTVFTFAAAHHFGRQRATLIEITRVLKPGGRAIYLYEPTSSNWVYNRAVARAVRPVVREDVLRWKRLCALAREVGLTARVDFFNPEQFGSIKSYAYRKMLALFPVMHGYLMSTADFTFTKPTT